MREVPNRREKAREGILIKKANYYTKHPVNLSGTAE